MFGRCGKLNPRYIDGRTSENHRIRNSSEYKEWAFAVLKRDNHTCQITGHRGGDLVPHHIFNFADYPELRLVVGNGITWNRGHHKIFHIMYGFGNNTLEQAQEFMTCGEIK